MGDKNLDYLVVNHMEPDHAAGIEEIVLRYPNVKIICTAKAALFMRQFGFDVENRLVEVKDSDTMTFRNP